MFPTRVHRLRPSTEGGFGVVHLLAVTAVVSTLAVMSVPGPTASRSGHELADAAAPMIKVRTLA